MTFNQLVSYKLRPIFQRGNLQITESSKNYIKFKSDNVVITLNHNERDNSNAFYVGSNEDFLYPIDEYLLKSVFKSNLKINQVTQEMFVNNLAVFFEGEGEPLLAGNNYTLEAIENFISKEGEEYTTQLVNKQNLNAANKAWEEGNYKDFIKYLNKIDTQKLPASYKLKYKKAIQKMKR